MDDNLDRKGDKMNPEIMYPELKDIKNSEILVEWAYIVRPKRVTKIFVRRVIPKKERNIFVKALEMEYEVIDNDLPDKDEYIELVTIQK